MARYSSSSVHLERLDSPAAVANWHSDDVESAYLSVTVDRMTHSYHGRYSQLQSIVDVMSAALAQLAATPHDVGQNG